MQDFEKAIIDELKELNLNLKKINGTLQSINSTIYGK